jgi:hypothetical protein
VGVGRKKSQTSSRRDIILYVLFEYGAGMVQAIIIEYAKSAFKHGVSEDNIRHAMLHPVYDEMQDEGGDKHLLLGFDSGMNLLEIAYHVIDERKFKVFHAMKCRNFYYKLLGR